MPENTTGNTNGAPRSNTAAATPPALETALAQIEVEDPYVRPAQPELKALVGELQRGRLLGQAALRIVAEHENSPLPKTTIVYNRRATLVDGHVAPAFSK